MSVAEVERWPFCDVKSKDHWPKQSVEGTPYFPSDSLHEKGTPADFGNAVQFAERTESEWVALFDRAPHIVHQILGDIYRETKAQAEREAGKARIGRRPKHVDGSLDDLHDMITPRYSMEPFAESVRELIDKSSSLRAFAKRAGINHHTITRMIRGEVALDRFRLEQLAKAGHVQPAYFAEYREFLILEALRDLLRARPNISVRVHKQIRVAREGLS